METEEVEEEDAEALPPAPARPTPAASLRGCGGRPTAAGHALGQEDIVFPIGERFAAIAITAAFFDARTVFIVLLAWGGFAMLYVLPAARLRSLVVMSATAIPSAAPPPSTAASVLDAYRDDGPLATAIGRALGRGIPLPPIALLVVAGLPLLLAIVVKGDGASEGLVAGVVAGRYCWAGSPARAR